MTLRLGAHDFTAPPFSKSESQWFRTVTRALGDAAGVVLDGVTPATFGAASSADASDLATAITLANELKAVVNAQAAALNAQNAQLVALSAQLDRLTMAFSA